MSSVQRDYQNRMSKRKSITKWLPVLGLLLAIAMAALAFILSEPVHSWLYDSFFADSERLRGIQGTSDSFDQEIVQYVVGGVMFFLFMVFFATIYALFAPKRKIKVSEKQLKKEREEKQAEVRRAKKRRQQLNRKMAAEREKRAREE
ncbi:MAG: hypothetical protein EA396_03445 [Anaerolineaceae bacterium]|nr:MAG: hypothetical protein EA396_03445 [Anaerolineaceae bacterium]